MSNLAQGNLTLIAGLRCLEVNPSEYLRSKGRWQKARYVGVLGHFAGEILGLLSMLEPLQNSGSSDMLISE